MKSILQILSFAGILLTIVPPVLYFMELISRSSQNLWMFAGTIIWFASATFWLGRKKETDQV